MTIEKKRLLMIGAVLLLLLVAACGPAVPPGSDEESAAETVEGAGDHDVSEDAEMSESENEEGAAEMEAEAEAEAEVESVSEESASDGDGETAVGEVNNASAAEIEYIEIEAGSGVQAKAGDVVSVHYTGMLDDGTVFDSSEGKEPITFVLGQGRVIQGWEQGIALMREGGKATLIIPPELGYGAGGSGTIPPNATLTFDVELVQVLATPEPEDIALEDYEVTESGLRYFDIEPGSGELLETGAPVSVHFNVWLEDGTSLGGTEGGPPASLQIDMGMLFPGLDEGISTMLVGGKRQMLIPSELAFGEAGAGSIPPNATLIAEAMLINVYEVPPLSTFPELAEADYEETASGLKYYDVTVGEGVAPEPGQYVIVFYTGWLEDGTVFDSSIERGGTFGFSVGMGEVIPGWDEGVATMKVGGTRILLIPAELAYGAQGAGGGLIPPDATLIFEVHLVDVQ